ncbi:U-box domain-containing protein 35 [Manihot esculenta]|uniref:UspA domain-containing protein n=1 Tax=Manihot esculenta TaxID=3983 RepID=A0A2C9V8Y5_MANES|nr:U-box domain-containing protein 35 [Manihot esculenta]OAY41230.1 hypothetical protein MANES_09G084200v8 [Manihot esculenta]
MSVPTTATPDNFHSEEETSSTTSNHHHNHQYYQYTSEIEEENSGELFEINHGDEPLESIKEEVFSLDVESRGEDCVYVGVGKSESSMDALSWTLKNLVNGDSTMIYLIHVFPEIHHIPSPLGKLPKNQVSPEQVEIYMAQERGKRRELLQKFIHLCSQSKVKVDTILVESDMVAKAILDLIPILNIKKLVLGTSKSSLRKLRARKGSGIADQILASPSEFCEIKIICEGKEVADNQTAGSPSPSPRPGGDATANPIQLQDQPGTNDSFSCMCFKSPRVM